MRIWSSINIVVQSLILIGILISLVTEPLLALALVIPFGAWQVISGIVYAFKYEMLFPRQKNFITIYLIASALVLAFLFIVYRQEIAFDSSNEVIIGIIASFSAILAISFYIFSVRVLKNVLCSKSDTHSDILDQL